MKNSPKHIHFHPKAIRRRKRLGVLLAQASCLALVCATGQAAAQQTVIIGSGAAPGITVNEDVLRTLDKPQGAPLPRLQLPGAAPTDQPIRLRPPPGVLDQGAGRLTLRRPSGAPTTQYRLHLPTGRYLPVAPPLTAPIKPRRQLALPAAPAQAAPAQAAPAQAAPKTARAAAPARTAAPSAQVLSRSVAPELIVVPPPPKAAPKQQAKKTASTPAAPAVPKAPITKAPPPPPAMPKAPPAPKAPKIAKVAPPPAPPAAPKAEAKKITPPPPPPPVKTEVKPQQRAKMVAPPAPKIPTPPAATTPAKPKAAPAAPPKPAAVPVPPPVQATKQPPKEQPKPQEAQKQAALTPPAAPAPSAAPGYGTLLTLKFASGASAISANNKSQLSQLAERLTGNTDRLQLKAYASAEGGTDSAARRLSLSRALTVRSQLIAQGIRSTRIDVRALGIAKSGDPDRVDVLLLKRP